MDILIEESSENLWAAALHKGRLEALEIDPEGEQVRWGSIYLAKIKTLDPARDAAFLDLDGYNTGILYNKDTRHTDDKGKTVKGGAEAISKRYQPGDMVLVQAKTAYVSGPYDDDIHEQKIPQMSMDITLQGRHLIYCAFSEGNRLSRRITDKKLRKTITAMLQKLDDLQGFIIRAAASHTQTDILRREAAILKGGWEEIKAAATGNTAKLVMTGPDAIQRILSDQADKHIDSIEITTMEHYNHAEMWAGTFAPDLVPKIVPVELDNAEEELALFYERDMVGQIEDLLQPYCLLPGGGNLIIQSTAALTAIDINTGGDKRAHAVINIEAAKEALRQIRLRNIGGVILIDFMKITSKEAAKDLHAVLEMESAKDSCTVQIHGLTGTGLMELSRNRRTLPLDKRIDPDMF
jgi:Rne/Rng family ribonuclease